MNTNITVWLLFKIITWSVLVIWFLFTLFSKYNELIEADNQIRLKQIQIEKEHERTEEKIEKFQEILTKMEKMATDIERIKKNLSNK